MPVREDLTLQQHGPSIGNQMFHELHVQLKELEQGEDQLNPVKFTGRVVSLQLQFQETAITLEIPGGDTFLVCFTAGQLAVTQYNAADVSCQRVLIAPVPATCGE